MSVQPRIPPPPPPPRTAEYGWEESHHGDEDLAATSAAIAKECLLHVSVGPESASPIVKVHVFPNMSGSLLGKCVSQAASQFRTDDSLAGAKMPQQLVGLYGETDHIFHSFEHILSLPDPTWQTYCTFLALPPDLDADASRRKSRVAATEIVLLMGGAVLSVLAYFHGEILLQVVASVSHTIFSAPFRELYRYGPHLIGWEGIPMEEICNRITHFGGREFWQQNTALCDQIYTGKEEAFLRIVRPVAYALCALFTFYLLKSLIVSYGESKRNKTDRAVIEAFHAFQTLVRIANQQQINGRRQR